jgi:hypothetical protein
MARATATFLVAAIAATLTATPAAEAQAVRRERVDIPAADTPVTIEASVRGFDSVHYLVGGATGDTMVLSLSADNPQTYFNLYAPGDVPGESTAMFIGARDGREYRGTLTNTGDYIVHVVLMRPAARRAETADFRLRVEVSGEGSEDDASDAAEASADPERTEAEARPAPAPTPGLQFKLTGQLPCAVTAEAPAVPCAYRAWRRGGTAMVFVTLANGDERAILFVGGYPVASDRLGAPFTASPEGSGTLVSIGDERYEIPYLVAAGN